MNKLLVGAACALALASIASAQQMTFIVADAHWQALSNTFVPETNDPIGLIQVNGSLVNTFATSNGDHCEANGISRDTVAGGSRLQQTATAIGFHTAEWLHVGPPDGEVELNQAAGIDGTVTLINTVSAAAALGFAEASSNMAPPALAVLDSSAASTVVGGLGSLSGAYAGGPAVTPIVGVGPGTFVDSDYASADAYACLNYLWVQHKSRAFIRVATLRANMSPGNAEATGSMTGDCTTWAYLGHCPE